MYFYACYGYPSDELSDEDDPRWRVPYVSAWEEAFPVGQDTQEPELPDTWEDSGPFNNAEDAWERAKQIAVREYRTSWEEN